MVILKRILIVFVLSISITQITAKEPVFANHHPDIKPHRIIRTCCSFGTEMQMFAIPGVKLTEITSLDKIGTHHYLGDKTEENGIIYTRRGGFVDMGHLRDQIDWMAYLFVKILENRNQGNMELILGYEGGEKILNVNISPNLTRDDLILLAGKITYDLSVWHEIATWFGASTIPFVPERYSSFSVEDAYSNLLGVSIGIESLRSDLNFEDAVTSNIQRTLKELEAVANEMETYQAMEAVRDVWWTRDKKLPSGKVLLERQVQVYSCLRPWLVPGWESQNKQVYELKIQEYTSDGNMLNNYYNLEFKLNYKFPFRKIFPERKDRNITQNDFDRMLAEVETEIARKESKIR